MCLGTFRHALDPRREDGIALVLALAVIVFFSITAVTAVTMSTSTQSTANRSAAGQTAGALAEAGINTAEGVLNSGSTNAASPTLLGCSVSAQNVNNSAVPCTDLTISTSLGRASFHGLYAQGTGNIGTWTITATGSMPSPNGGGTTVNRSTTATVTITGGGQANNISVWNYVYSTAPQGGGCEVDLNGDHTTIEVPMYVTGDLCLSGDHSEIVEDKKSGGQAVDLRVGGTLSITGNHATVGCPTSGPGHGPGPGPDDCGDGPGKDSTPLTSGYVAGGCISDPPPASNSTPHPCTTADSYYVSQVDTPLTASAPVTDFPNWYLNASPGPKHVCDTHLTPAPNLTATKNVFDNDTTMNATNTMFNLTPNGAGATDYNCVTSTGSLSWNHTTHVLKIGGTIFFDGDVYVSDPPGPADAMYQGKGTIYVNGQLSFNSNGKPGPGGEGGLRAACADPHGNLHQCDMNGDLNGPNHWDPNTNMVVFAVNKPSGIAIDLGTDHSEFQGDLLCTPGSTASLAGDHTQLEGGIICGKFTFGNHTEIFPMPTITNLPPGAPLPPNAAGSISPPIYIS